jgi:hypothetical protein
VDKYEEYAKHLLSIGASQVEATEAAAHMREEDQSLGRRICPRCGAGIGRREDPRQVGVPELAGTWFNYRCRCGYMVDRKE